MNRGREFASNAEKVIVTGAHFRRSEWRSATSQRHQNPANPRKTHVSGNAYEPVVPNMSIAMAVPAVRTSAAVARTGLSDVPSAKADDPIRRCKASAAQIARTK